MKTRTKKAFAWLMTFAMLLSLLPAAGMTALAAPATEDTTAKVGDYEIVVPKGAENPGDLSGTTPTVVTSDTAELGTGWYVVNSTVSRTGPGTGTYLEHSKVVTVTGDAKLILCDGMSWTLTNSGDYADGIQLNDNASLTIYGQTQGTGALSVTVGSKGSNGICAPLNKTGNVSIAGGKVTVNSIAYGIYAASGNVSITGGCVGVTNETSNGICANTVNISGGNVTVKTSKMTGIETGSGNVNISGGSVTVDSPNDSGIYTNSGTVNISGGEVTVTKSGGGSSGGGICAKSGNVNISGGEVTVNNTGYNGIYAASGNVSITGGTVGITVESGNSNLHGIYAGGTTEISNSPVTVDVNSPASVFGIYPKGNLTITGSTVTSTVTGKKGKSIGSSDGSVSIQKASKVTATFNNASTVQSGRNGIYGYRGMTIASSEVEANSTQYGIYSSSGNTTITGSRVTANGGEYGIYLNPFSYSTSITSSTVTATGGTGGIFFKTTTKYPSYPMTVSGNGTSVTAEGTGTNGKAITGCTLTATGLTVKAGTNEGSAAEITDLSTIGNYKYATIQSPHTHAWTYATSKSVETLTADDTITASCTEDCPYAGTDKSLTIAAPATLTYDGSDKTATFGTATTFLGGALPTITYEYKATKDGTYAATTETKKAGCYKASFTVGSGEGAKTACVEYTIARAQVDVPTAGTGFVYDKTEKTALTIAEDALYELDSSFEGGKIKATDAGTYSFYVKLKDANTANYEWNSKTPDQSQQIMWSIAKAEVAVPKAETELTYNGTERTGVPAGDFYGITDNTAINAGDYTAVATLTDSNNYKWNDGGEETATRDISWSIAKAEVTLPTAETNLVYNGTVQTGVKCPENAVYTLSDNTATNADTNYTATASLGDNAKNYKWAGTESSEDQTIPWSIAKRTVTLWSASGSKQYDKSPLALPDVYADETKTAVDSVFANDVENLKATGSVTNVSQGQVTNTISYTYKAGKSADNFDITSVTEGVLSISKAGAMSLVGAGYTGTYDGKEHTAAAVPGVTEGTTVTYSTSTDNVAWSEYSATIPQITDVGTLYVRAKAVNDDYDDAECTYTLTVTPAKVTVPTAVTGLIYNGTEQTGVILPEDAVYTLENNTGTDVTDYQATATLKDTNHVWDLGDGATSAENQTINWSIAKYENNAITNLTCANVKIGETPAPSAEVKFGEITYSYAKAGSTSWDTWENTYNGDSGEYQVRASVAETTNYNGDTSDPVTFRVGYVCEGWKIVKFDELNPGQYKMYLNNTDTGVYNFAMVVGGYTIQDATTEEYLCLENGKIVKEKTTNPTVWAKGIASFHASAVSTGRWGCCTRYYLNVDKNGNLIADRLPGITHFATYVEADEHEYCVHSNFNGTHTHTCIVCGDSYEETCTPNRWNFCTECGGYVKSGSSWWNR